MALRVRIEGRDRQAMTDLVREHQVDVVRTTAKQHGDGKYAVDAVVTPEGLERLTAAGYRIDVLDDVDKVARQRRADIDWHPDDRPDGLRPGPLDDIRDRGPIR